MKLFSKVRENKIFNSPYRLHIGVAACMLFLMILGVSVPLALFLGASTLGAKLVVQKYNEGRRNKKLTEQVPDTVEALANAMKAGYSFEQALIFVTRESVEPIKESLEYAVEKINYSFSTKEALEALQERTQHSDVKLVVDGILMQYKIGGNIIEMLENMSNLMRERLKLQNDLNAFTAQGRFSGILIALLCPVSLFMFYIISPEYVGVLFTTLPGQFLLILAAILEIVGFRLIWNITHLKV